jgi:uncharacterized protein
MLTNKLKGDQKRALKEGNSQKRMTLGMVINAIKNKELEKRAKSGKDEGNELTDDEALAIIKSEIKKRRDSIEQYEKGDRPELAQSEKEEMSILLTYVPEQMPEDAIRDEIKKIVDELDAKDIKDMGRVIKEAMARFHGNADGSVVSRIVKETLP